MALLRRWAFGVGLQAASASNMPQVTDWICRLFGGFDETRLFAFDPDFSDPNSPTQSPKPKA
jgi:hypothetical protein